MMSDKITANLSMLLYGDSTVFMQADTALQANKPMLEKAQDMIDSFNKIS
jgi:hypothetical protein